MEENSNVNTQVNEKSDTFQNKKKIFLIIVLCIAGLFIVGVVVTGSIYLSNLNDVYQKAVALADNGSYKEAEEQFEEIGGKNYKDTSSYIFFCKAHLQYSYGNVSNAYYYAEKARFRYMSADQTEKWERFVSAVENEYEVYKKKESEAQIKAYYDRIANGVPYVGMSESNINSTSLGSPSSDVRHNTEMINGRPYRANLYDFKIGNKVIFVARCVRGQVTEVWDYRDKPFVRHTPKNDQKPKKNYDPYDIDDYSDPEDFYYDHYDDFYDYYDAEDYYNKHHK